MKNTDEKDRPFNWFLVIGVSVVSYLLFALIMGALQTWTEELTGVTGFECKITKEGR